MPDGGAGARGEFATFIQQLEEVIGRSVDARPTTTLSELGLDDFEMLRVDLWARSLGRLPHLPAGLGSDAISCGDVQYWVSP